MSFVNDKSQDAFVHTSYNEETFYYRFFIIFPKKDTTMTSTTNTRYTIGFQSTVPALLLVSTMALSGCQNEDIEKINNAQNTVIG